MSAALKKDHYDAQHDNDAQRELRFLFKTAWELLANEPHPTIPGLRRRYYYRGKFWLMECLSPRALAWNVERLRRREPEHAARLAITAGSPGYGVAL
jgi:hypothetical protein